MNTRNTKLFISGLGTGIQQKEVLDLFSRHGKILSCSVKNNYAFVEFSHPDDADDAIRGLDGYIYHGKKLVVQLQQGYKERKQQGSPPRGGDPSPFSRTRIYVGGLTEGINIRELEEVFSEVGHVVRTVDKKSFAFLEYETSAHAEKAIKKFNGTDFAGRRLIVNFATIPFHHGRPSGTHHSPRRGRSRSVSRSLSRGRKRLRYSSLSRSRSRSTSRSPTRGYSRSRSRSRDRSGWSSRSGRDRRRGRSRDYSPYFRSWSRSTSGSSSGSDTSRSRSRERSRSVSKSPIYSHSSSSPPVNSPPVRPPQANGIHHLTTTAPDTRPSLTIQPIDPSQPIISSLPSEPAPSDENLLKSDEPVTTPIPSNVSSPNTLQPTSPPTNDIVMTDQIKTEQQDPNNPLSQEPPKWDNNLATSISKPSLHTTPSVSPSFTSTVPSTQFTNTITTSLTPTPQTSTTSSSLPLTSSAETERANFDTEKEKEKEKEGDKEGSREYRDRDSRDKDRERDRERERDYRYGDRERERDRDYTSTSSTSRRRYSDRYGPTSSSSSSSYYPSSSSSSSSSSIDRKPERDAAHQSTDADESHTSEPHLNGVIPSTTSDTTTASNTQSSKDSLDVVLSNLFKTRDAMMKGIDGVFGELQRRNQLFSQLISREEGRNKEIDGLRLELVNVKKDLVAKNEMGCRRIESELERRLAILERKISSKPTSSPNHSTNYYIRPPCQYSREDDTTPKIKGMMSQDSFLSALNNSLGPLCASVETTFKMIADARNEQQVLKNEMRLVLDALRSDVHGSREAVCQKVDATVNDLRPPMGQIAQSEAQNARLIDALRAQVDRLQQQVASVAQAQQTAAQQQSQPQQEPSYAGAFGKKMFPIEALTSKIFSIDQKMEQLESNLTKQFGELKNEILTQQAIRGVMAEDKKSAARNTRKKGGTAVYDI